MSKSDELKTLAIRGEFTDKEWSERQRHVSTLKNFAGASVAAAKALSVIRDKKLFRPYKTLKEFCQRECGWTEQRLYQVIKFAKVRAALPGKTKQLLSHESQARELARVPEEQRSEVLEEVAATGPVTAEAIKTVAASKQSDNGVYDNMGYPMATKSMAYWNRRPEVQELLRHISGARTILGKIKDGDPLYRRVNAIRSKREKLDDYYNEFKGALPEYVCYSCDGLTPQQCRLCGGTGVVSEFEWKSKADPAGHQRREQAIKKLKNPF